MTDHSTPPDEVPLCDHRDHDEPVAAVAEYEGLRPPAGPTFRYWTCAQHEPDGGHPLRRIDSGPTHRTKHTDPTKTGGP